MVSGGVAFGAREKCRCRARVGRSKAAVEEMDFVGRVCAGVCVGVGRVWRGCVSVWEVMVVVAAVGLWWPSEFVWL